MKYDNQQTAIPYGKLINCGASNECRPTTSILLLGEACLIGQETESGDVDYSEEAIPERDPAYRLPAGTEFSQPTVDAMSAEFRSELANRLQQLGMSRSRAAFVASL